MKKILSFAMSIVLVLGIVGCGGKGGASSGAWQEQYDLGIRYLADGHYQEAVLAFTAAIKIDPKQADLYIGRAEAYLRTGETAETLASALADYEAALDINDGLVTGWLGLADVYIRMGDYEKALEVLKDALAKTGNDAAIADKIAELESGNVSDAFGQRRRMSTYDAAGNLIWYHTYTYDAQGRGASITSYDGAGNQTGHVDEEYDANGNQTTSYYYYTETGEVGRIEYEYDAEGRRISGTDYDLDGKITVLDATRVQKRLASLV